MTNYAIECILGNLRGSALLAASRGPVSSGHEEYCHVWPRDSVFAGLELFEEGLSEGIGILEYVIDLRTVGGLLFQRYEVSGEPDSFGWTNYSGGFQLDQDALKFVGASRIFSFLSERQKKKLRRDFHFFVKAVERRESATDVWEQKRGYFFYTTAAIIWGMQSGGKFFGENRVLLNELVESIDSFYSRELNSFVKMPGGSYLDLEVVLGLNVLLQTGFFNNSLFLIRSINSLKEVERELVVEGRELAAPIRYKGDFWDGERVGEPGIGRPWPMGCALLSQVYSRLYFLSLELGFKEVSEYCRRKSFYWLSELEGSSLAMEFPEQIDCKGFIPVNSPVPLSWSAAEYLRAKRIAGLIN